MTEVEQELDKVLNKPGNFHSIQKKVNPKTLTSCETNALFKSFEVNKILKDLVKRAEHPETEEIKTLSNLVDKFTCAFIDPLRSDGDARNTFKSCLDSVVDKAIDAKQKKFLSHPVVYDLLNSRWYGSFTSVRKKPWTSASRWGYLFLNLLSVLDIFFFPLLFALLFFIRLINERSRKARENELCFVVTLNKNATCEEEEEAFKLIQKTIKYRIYKYGYRSANYSVILHDEVYTPRALQKSNASPRFYEDLFAACDAFKSPVVRTKAKKILVVFTNDKLSKEKQDLIYEIAKLGVLVIPVGIGEEAKLSELEKIARKNTTALHFGEYEAPKTIGKAIIQGVEGNDILDLYLDYFTTPYFVFVRDSLSHLALLVLHFVFSLSPPTIAFSRLEWVIFIFFLGRILLAVGLFMGAKKADRKTARQRLHQGSSYVMCSLPDESQTMTKESEKNAVIKMFTYYFSDRWILLDCIILVIYIVTFTLRMYTWATSVNVSDNRPLAVAGYLYGLIAMILTLRVFCPVMEYMRGMGAIQIALFLILWEVLAIFWHFLTTILAFSLAITKIYVVEKSYVSNDASDEALKCKDEGFICWWIVTKHLAWSLLGIQGYKKLESIDTASTTLAFLLYSLFLIMGVILLINMMVALLSNTYQRVQDNSLREWYFKKAITIRAYSLFHPVPVPFNLVSFPIFGIWKLCQCCVSEKNRFADDKYGLDESGKKTTLDNLAAKLETTYFATYGYSFPLTDEGKMDQVFRETKGLRGMADQIIQRVFRQQSCKQNKCIARTNAWETFGIGIKGCLLTYERPDVCDGCKRKQPVCVHGARYRMPFTPETPRMEVLIVDSGERRLLAVGAVSEGYDCYWAPGWKEGTVGYHVDDGKIFEPGYNELGREVEAMANRGDLIACEVDFSGATNETFPVLFFLNGRMVDQALMKRETGETNPFPFISMGYEGIRVLAQMCPASGSGMPLVCHASPEQHFAKDNKNKYDRLRKDMEKILERERKVQAMEFQEKLDKQWRMLLKIHDLVMLSLPERKTKESSDNNDVFGSDVGTSSKSVVC